jgi:hypothetical protein
VCQAQLLIAQNRRPFVAWVTLLSFNHPSPRCRAGSSHLLASLDQVWPLGEGSHPTAQLERWRPCGRRAESQDWVRSPLPRERESGHWEARAATLVLRSKKLRIVRLGLGTW